MAKKTVQKKTNAKKRAGKKASSTTRNKKKQKAQKAQKSTKKQKVKKGLDLGDAIVIRPLNPDFLNTPISGAGAMKLEYPTLKTSQTPSLPAGKTKTKRAKAPRKRAAGNSTKAKKAKRGNKEKELIDMNENLGPSSPKDFEKYKIIPDLLDKTKLSVLDCHFLTKGVKLVVENWQFVKAEDTIEPPVVTWTPKSGTSYAIVMLNVDSPKPEEPTFRSWNHWGVCNVSSPSEINSGTVFCEYIACCPAKGYGVHRFCIVLLEQIQSKIKVIEDVIVVEKSQASGRPRWDLRNFTRKYGLIPIAAKVFRSTWDSSCPSTYEKMGF